MKRKKWCIKEGKNGGKYEKPMKILSMEKVSKQRINEKNEKKRNKRWQGKRMKRPNIM